MMHPATPDPAGLDPRTSHTPDTHMSPDAPTKPRRVLLLEGNEDGTVGGSHQAQYDLVRLMDRTRFEPVVAYYQENRFAGLMREEGVEVLILDELRRREYRLRTQGSAPAKAWSILVGAIAERRRLIRSLGVDLVHLNNSPGSGFDDWLPAARLNGIPCVTFAMGNAPRELGRLQQAMAQRFDRIFVISDQVQRTFIEAGYPRDRLSMTQIGVDVQRFRKLRVRTREEVRRELGLPEEQVVACMVGNLRHWKGQHVVLEGLRRMDPEIRERLTVLFVGSVGPEFQDYFQGLEGQVAKWGLEGSVRFVGGRTDVPDILGASDLGLHASVLPEPFGLVVVEAMAMGIPAVATSHGGPATVVTPDTGITHSPEDPGELAEALTRLVQDPDLRLRLGANASARAEEYDARVMVREIQRVYEEILGNGRP